MGAIMEGLIENVIEWENGDDVISVTFSQKKYVNKVKRLAKRYPEKVQIIAENKDGSIFAHLPLTALKLSIILREELGESDKKKLGERLRRSKEKES